MDLENPTRSRRWRRIWPPQRGSATRWRILRPRAATGLEAGTGEAAGATRRMRTRRRKHSDAIGRAETGVEGPGGARRGGEPWTRRGLGGATERRGGASFALLAPVRDCQRSRRRHGGGLFSFFEQRMPSTVPPARREEDRDAAAGDLSIGWMAGWLAG